MEQGMKWVGVTCMVFILGCLWETTCASELDMNPWLPLPLLEQDIEDTGVENARKSQYLIQEKTSQETDNTGLTSEKYGIDKTERYKRVFLSRGWGPGGYEAPPPPPQRFVRRPPALQPLRTKLYEKLPPIAVGGNGGARFAPLVSPRRPEQIQQKPQYRGFHSIFTSGTWSPLGKRGGGINADATFENSPKKNKGNNLQNLLGFLLDDEGNLVVDEDKRSGVFASSGWGAGGSSPPHRHPWRPYSTNNWRSSLSPRVINITGDGNSSSGDRHKTSFMSDTLPKEDKPLYHLFVSHGWGPMGR